MQAVRPTIDRSRARVRCSWVPPSSLTFRTNRLRTTDPSVCRGGTGSGVSGICQSRLRRARWHETAVRKRTSPNSPTAKVSVEVGPVSGLANASKGRRNVFPHPFGAVTLKIRLRFAYRCGGSPGIKRAIARLHRIPVSLASLRGLVRAPDNDLRLSQTDGNDNTARDAARTSLDSLFCRTYYSSFSPSRQCYKRMTLLMN